MRTKIIFDNYELYEDGRIFSHKTKRFLSPIDPGKGYPRQTLYYRGKRISIRLHRSLAEAFIPNPKKLPEVNHIDENKANNSLSNLEWTTRKANMKHSAHKMLKGVSHPNAKLSLDQVNEIKKKYKPYICTRKQLAIEYGVSIQTIHNVFTGVTYEPKHS